MDGASVAAARKRPNWSLDPEVAKRTQGLVVSGFGKLPCGLALFLRLGAPEGEPIGGAWLATLQEVAPVTSAVPPARCADTPARAAALALSWAGLARMRLPGTALASFSRPFREGMMQEDRLRRLGDRRGGAWLKTVIEGGPTWSANTPRQERPTTEHAFDVAKPAADEDLPTPKTAHALLLLYTATDEDAGHWATAVLDALRPHGVTEEHRLPLLLDIEGNGPSSEHFGFADGMSQPEPFDADGAVLRAGERVRMPAPVQGAPLGEFLMGYVNGHRERAPGPVVPGGDDGDHRPAEAGLHPHPEAAGFYDLGLNGSYLVVRELKQDVAAFWRSMDAAAAQLRETDPVHAGHVTAEWIAERVVGRTRQGHLLCPVTPGGCLPADEFDMPDNNFLFHPRDPHGMGCPAGSHVRRANPRDALGRTAEEGAGLLGSANNHRILRRGRKFGPKIENDRVDDGRHRGLLFMCLNTDIARQFEFVQQTWMLNSDFATLYEETDPLLGPPGRMTIRAEALRRTVHVDTFVRLVGGDYFFLPSLPALAYLARL